MSDRRNKKIKDKLRRLGQLDTHTDQENRQHERNSKMAKGFSTVIIAGNKEKQHWGKAKVVPEPLLNEYKKPKQGIIVKRKHYKVFGNK